ncbi:MAG: glycosyltransferase family 2 protein [Sarcina sp.]
MLGVVIANWNGENLIGNCLESFCNQSYKNFKIYIVDNGSVDRSLEIIEKYKEKLSLKVIELTENKGFALANNIGMSKAISDGSTHILTINNDTEIEIKALEKAVEKLALTSDKVIYQLFMINYFEREICDAAGITWDEKLLPTQIGYKENKNDVLLKNSKIKGACAGAAIYPVKALVELQLTENEYFDNNFFAYYEDVDLAIRLFRNGYKTELLEESIVYHVHSATGKKSNGFKEYYLYRNMFIYTKRNQLEMDYKKNKLSYYKVLLGGMKRNIMEPKVFMKILKGGVAGIRESKKIECIK